MELIAEDKSGKVKFTFEMEINPAVMSLIREDIDMMTDIAMQGADAIRSQMQSRRKQGQEHGMMMHGHGMYGHG